MPNQIPIGLVWGENPKRSTSDQTHIEWHAACGCAFHPHPFPHIHPCSEEHKRPDLHGPADGVKIVRSQDVLNAITDTLAPIKSQRWRVADVGMRVLQSLSNVLEFRAKA
jgi:hypothetical protein